MGIFPHLAPSEAPGRWRFESVGKASVHYGCNVLGRLAEMLIVDDNRMFREAFVDRMRRRFPQLPLETAASCAEGRLKARLSKPRLAVVDLMLPDGNGMELVADIRRENPLATVAICTCHGLPEYREAASRMGITQFFVKDRLDFAALDTLVRSSQ